MFKIEVDEFWMTAIEDLKLENVRYEKLISENTPMMNSYFRGVIQRNNETIDRYTEDAIRIIIYKRA